MKSQNIALILILSLVSASFASEQLIQPIMAIADEPTIQPIMAINAPLLGGYGNWSLPTVEQRTHLKEALRKIYSSNFSQYVQDLKKYTALLVQVQVVAGQNLKFLVIGVEKLFVIVVYRDLQQNVTLSSVAPVTLSLTPSA